MTMPVVYVAGPFRAPTMHGVLNNIREAERYGLALVELGCCPLIPHANTGWFHGTATEDFWLGATLELLRRADAVLATPRWRDSQGATGEVLEADRIEIPNFYPRGLPFDADVRKLILGFVASWQARRRTAAGLAGAAARAGLPVTFISRSRPPALPELPADALFAGPLREAAEKFSQGWTEKLDSVRGAARDGFVAGAEYSARVPRGKKTILEAAAEFIAGGIPTDPFAAATDAFEAGARWSGGPR